MVAQKKIPLFINTDLAVDLQKIRLKKIEGEEARKKLGELLQSALQLEFSTVPPYLSAAFSVREDNDQIVQLIVRVAKEEMLHMTVVANLLNAIGISPNIIAATPTYPYKLDVLDPPLELNLCSLSLELIEDLFMRIETPEDPVDFPSQLGLLDEEAPLPETIGQFYEQIIDIIKNDTIPNLFENAERDAFKQIPVVLKFRKFAYLNNDEEESYPLDQNITFIITDKKSAEQHLKWVVDQGEGAAPFDPLTAEGIPGHYYRFESILKAKYLVKDETVPDLGYSFSGADLPFFPAGVHEFDVNAKAKDFTAHPKLEKRMKRFNEKYTDMIKLLEIAFNCPSHDLKQRSEEAYFASISVMRKMNRLADRIINEAQESGVKAGIPFQYQPDGQDGIEIA